MGRNARTGSTPVPSTRERLLFLSFFVSLGRCNGVGEGLRPAAAVISLLCAQVRTMLTTTTVANGNLANTYLSTKPRCSP